MKLRSASSAVSRALGAIRSWLRDTWLGRVPIVDWLRVCPFP
jgi:hypothetical protein